MRSQKRGDFLRGPAVLSVRIPDVTIQSITNTVKYRRSLGKAYNFKSHTMYRNVFITWKRFPGFLFLDSTMMHRNKEKKVPFQFSSSELHIIFLETTLINNVLLKIKLTTPRIRQQIEFVFKTPNHHVWHRNIDIAKSQKRLGKFNH